MNWSEWFYCDEDSPTGLRWKVEILSGRGLNVLRTYPGMQAGSLKKNGRYAQVSLCGVNYSVHVIVWELHNGKVAEGCVVDHYDGNEQNNKIGNLREVTGIVNARNCKKQTNNLSGVTGVSFMETKGSRYWVASWRCADRGGLRQKCFSIVKLGNDVAFALACALRQKQIEELNTCGAGYTERHGT